MSLPLPYWTMLVSKIPRPINDPTPSFRTDLGSRFTQKLENFVIQFLIFFLLRRVHQQQWLRQSRRIELDIN